ncbi:sal-like protein 4 [Pangasianodon hypophthalmus]|uniref:sal-like protein 4 n=1 Tax=Pangasianodon hypophthalmus TaxID=310915 RepID=UPI0023076BE1|nr:sal-like protein 4 [Pangasianodon hypophthalmus]XP_026792630.3 sal-like protein 4 [Pangasianodon hypophthalmus]XP_053089429.1 sal-like protein 4 [Pangasianodon hypophthalmus]
MSRRKQKRPQQLVNADPGGTRLASQDNQLAVKSPSNSLASEPTSSSSSSPSPSSLQDCQPPLAPRPSPGGLHAPSLPNESSSPPHWPSHIVPYTTSLPNTHSSLSPDFPHPSLSSQTHSPPPVQQKASHIPVHQPHSNISSPQMGISATTNSSSSTSSSSLNAIPHARSPNSTQQPPSSLPEEVHVPPTLAVLLEELRVLQQRQIHQMQMTEEICRQVLRLGGVITNQDTASLETSQRTSESLSPSLSTSGPSQSTASSISSSLPTLIPESVSNLNICNTNGHKDSYSSSSSTPSSSASSLVSSGASVLPLSLSLGIPRYLHEKSSNTSLSQTSAVSYQTPSLLTSSTQEQMPLSSAVGTSAGSLSTSTGRQQHVCRFCGKVLSSDSSLQIHLRSHTGERPYQCPVCLSRFTTRGNLKAHFLRHREQNPELSLSLLPPALSEQNQSGSGLVAVQRRRKRRAEDEEPFAVKGGVSVPDGLALGFLSGSSSRLSSSSLPLPPSVDLALLSTAHSLLQLNRASSATVASASASIQSSSASTTPSSSSSSITNQFKGAKQQRFDENTPPHSTIHPTSPYSQLAHLPKILFPSGPSPHHPGLALLRPPHLPSPHPQLTFPFSPYPKPQSSSPSSSSPSSSTATSDTCKLQRLAQKLEKQPPSKPFSEDQTNGITQANDVSTTTTTNTISEYRREMMTALGLNPNPNSDLSTQSISGSIPSLPSLVPNQCGVCLRVLSCPRALRLHQATHLGERPFPCKLCGRSFSTKGSLRAHLATHRARPPNTRTQNSCPLCQRKFTNAVVLQHHIRMHLGGQLPPEGNGDLGTEEQTDQMGSVVLPKTIQSLPLNMSMSVSSSIASTLQSSTVSKTSTSPDAKQAEDSDACDKPVSQVNPITDQVLEKQDPTSPFTSDSTSANSSPLEEDPDNDANPSGVSDYSLSALKALHNKPQTCPVVSKTREDDENIPLSLCTRTSSQDSLPNSRDFTGPSNLVVSEPKSNPQSAALDLSPALTPPSSPSHQPKPELRGTQKAMPVNGKGMDPELSEGGESLPSIVTNGAPEEESENTIPRDVQDSKRKEGVIKPTEINHGNWVKDEVEMAQPDTPVILPPPARSEKPYSCMHCGKEYASRSGLKGHMKTHSGGMTNELNASVVPQSAEGNYKDTMETSPHASSGNLQEDRENGTEKTSEKLALTEDSLATAGSADGGQEPEDRS